MKKEPKKDIYPGLQFNNFTVLNLDENSGGHGHHYKWFVKCDCGEIQSIRSQSIRKRSCKCNKCFSGEDLTGQTFGGKNGKILILDFAGYDTRYNRKRSQWKYKCLKCNSIKIETGDVIKRGDISTCGNKKCKPKGIYSPKYNPSSKFLYSRSGQKHREWTKNIFIRDNYKCIICGSKNNIQAHHLNGWNWDSINHFNINNGVTLCSNKPDGCHCKFHKEYKSGNNTFNQFLEYIQDNTILFVEIFMRQKYLQS